MKQRSASLERSYAVKLEIERRDFENYFAEILFIYSRTKI